MEVEDVEERYAANTHLEDVSPILPLIVQPLVYDLHDLDEIVPTRIMSDATGTVWRLVANSLVERHLRELVHLLPGWWPWVVTGRVPDLDLGMRVALAVVLGCAQCALTQSLKHGYRVSSQRSETRLQT